MYTVPTGFSSVPPSGPAMPVMPIPKSAPDTRRTPRAISAAVSDDTAPCASSVSWRTPSIFSLIPLE